MSQKKLLNSKQYSFFYEEYHKFLQTAKKEIENRKYLIPEFCQLLRDKNIEFRDFSDQELKNQITAYRRVEGTVEWPNISDLKNYVSPYTRSFIEKSHQSALLAVEIYNKPMISYRSEGFIVMMMIAWTSLFHAILLSDGEKIKYKEKDEENYLDLRKCIRKFFGKQKKEIEANLNLLIEVRDRIVHREDPVIDEKLFGYCQACLNNYIELLNERFGNNFQLPISLAHSIQFSKKYEPQQLEIFKRNKNEYSYKILDFIKKYEDNLYKSEPNVYKSQSYCLRIYIVPKLVKEKSADASVEYINYNLDDEQVSENIGKAILLIKENRVGGDHFKASEVCRIIIDRMKNTKGDNWKFSPSVHHSKAAKYFNIREGYKTDTPEKTKKEYCLYEPLFKSYIYTKQWIDFLAKKVKNDDIYKEIMKST